jgi:CheY-like chemotaxis protein
MKLIVIDDETDIEPLFQQKFRKELKANEYELEYFLSAEEALDYLNKNGYDNKIILSDINMPGISGLELLFYIRKNAAPPPPVIFMITAYGDQDNKNKAVSLGANAFMTKPIDFKLLKEKLREIVNDKNTGS